MESNVDVEEYGTEIETPEPQPVEQPPVPEGYIPPVPMKRPGTLTAAGILMIIGGLIRLPFVYVAYLTFSNPEILSVEGVNILVMLWSITGILGILYIILGGAVFTTKRSVWIGALAIVVIGLVINFALIAYSAYLGSQVAGEAGAAFAGTIMLLCNVLPIILDIIILICLVLPASRDAVM